MIVVPSGQFDMGSPRFEGGRQDHEGPVHRVSIPSFAMAKTELTLAHWSAFVRETGYRVTSSKCWVWGDSKWEEKIASWSNPGFKQTDQHPVTCISWEHAQAYVEWLSQKTGKAYRLPTEAEWEYAARAGTTTSRYWGNDSDQACNYANEMDRTGKSQLPGINWETFNCSDGYAWTAPVASFKPNAFGFYDMIGNLAEWTQDCWNPNYLGAPTDGTSWMTGDCNIHPVRGSSWSAERDGERSARRAAHHTNNIGSGLGIRLVRTMTD